MEGLALVKRDSYIKISDLWGRLYFNKESNDYDIDRGESWNVDTVNAIYIYGREIDVNTRQLS